jgi:ATP-dependent RNA helicase DDX51/DBP6
MISCEPSQKPLMLFHLAHNHGVTNALVFTKSTESTARLVKLFKFFEGAWASAADVDQVDENRRPLVIRAYSSDLAVTERKAILEKFKAQEIDM